jgi:hypothetical protein
MEVILVITPSAFVLIYYFKLIANDRVQQEQRLAQKFWAHQY